MTGETSAQKPKKNRDLSRSRVLARYWLFFNHKLEGHVLHDVQGMANTLSTEAPTDFGGNFAGSVENRLNPREFGVFGRINEGKRQIEQYLINPLKATICKVCSGQRTSYPQKRQQRLGASVGQ
ncbi:hypothetical protein J3D54_002123 [Pseudomonas sp. GGS8]|uniref:hypothetical protein n=1 Tax=Pseudomonas sp. GGS8 TaxID=2817892 RepID=UPI00209F0632|nr:hypothetical protein [Pseudomonas sp. GGS8]MCP1442991.1 hypothetical protein [Pseudomonas sp. GGS8]